MYVQYHVEGFINIVKPAVFRFEEKLSGTYSRNKKCIPFSPGVARPISVRWATAIHCTSRLGLFCPSTLVCGILIHNLCKFIFNLCTRSTLVRVRRNSEDQTNVFLKHPCHVIRLFFVNCKRCIVIYFIERDIIRK